MPLGVLDTLFIAFVAVQATVLFGGHDHVLETEGLTYAEYARQGFWQLLGVSALTMLVISGVIRVAGRVGAADRRMLRILVGTMCATSVVVVISAIHRMWLYQQAYGFSVQRIMVIGIESWLGVVFVLIAVAGIRMTGRWLPHAVLVAGAVTLLGLAAINPERLIAERNIDRYEQTGQLDTEYLLSLSSDIDQALARLPEPIRQCASTAMMHRTPGMSSTCRARAQTTTAPRVRTYAGSTGTPSIEITALAGTQRSAVNRCAPLGAGSRHAPPRDDAWRSAGSDGRCGGGTQVGDGPSSSHLDWCGATRW